MADTAETPQQSGLGQLIKMENSTAGVDSAHSPASTIEDTKAGLDTVHSPGSTIEDTDNYQDRYDQSEPPSLPRHDARPDPRQSLNHVLSSHPGDVATPPKRDISNPLSTGRSKSNTRSNTSIVDTTLRGPPGLSKNPVTFIHEGPRDGTEDEGSVQNDSYSRNAEVNSQPTMTVNAAGGSRRTLQGNGTIGSVYSGNKIRHLKKEDGIPLWRKDIQYNFLRQVFEDDTKVFTKSSDGTTAHSFADIYIDAMARSSKTSKILKDKLLQEKGPARNMAMVCLLVNVGRMNTTLNFFPEMRAQLRTYHSIPCLQAHEDPNAYKQLQDAPRLKSILKGASEDTDQPNSIEKIKERPIPRTNAVNLIFVLSQYAPRVSEMHFKAPRDFFDLVMRSTLSSASRAKAFLWLMWWYLESDFSREHALNNPFGSGQDGDGTGGLPIKVPELVSLREEQANLENVDTQEEIDFGEMKRLERKRILEEDEAMIRAEKRSKKRLNSSILPSEDEALGSHFGATSSPFGDDGHHKRKYGAAASGSGGRFLDVHTPGHPLGAYRPLSPGSAGASPSRQYYEDDDASSATVIPPSGRGRWKRHKRDTNDGPTRVLKTKMDQIPDSTSPAPPGYGHPVLNQFQGAESGTITTQRRPRPITQHQMALAQSRRERAETLLDQQRRDKYRELRKARESDNFLFRAARRIEELPDDYDTEDEDPRNAWGPGGLVPNSWAEPEDAVYGEEASHWSKTLRRAKKLGERLFGTVSDGKAPEMAKVASSMGAYEGHPAAGAVADPEPDQVEVSAAGDGDADEDLDDIDKELLGEASYEDGVGETGDSGVEGDESEEDIMEEE